MEFLKELFGEKPLTFDEFTDKVNQKGLKLFDLSAGGYMSMEKHRGIVEGLKEQLNTANEKLTDYDPEWKQKSKAAEEAYQAQLAQRDQKDWLEKQMESYGVQSPYARKQLIADCMDKDRGLPWKDGAFLGFADFMEAAKKEDNSLYLTEAEKDAQNHTPYFTDGLGGGIPSEGNSKFTPPQIF